MPRGGVGPAVHNLRFPHPHGFLSTVVPSWWCRGIGGKTKVKLGASQLSWLSRAK